MIAHLQDPVPADQQQVAAEAAAVAGVASRTCPVQAVLDRLVITSTGMVVACWQVSSSLGICHAKRCFVTGKSSNVGIAA